MTLRIWNLILNTKVQQKAEGNTLPLTIPMFDQDAVFFEKTNSHRVSFLNAVTEKGVSVYYPDFESLAIWTPAGGKAPFLCLEPWNGSAIFHQDDDVFAHKHGIIALETGKRSNLSPGDFPDRIASILLFSDST